MKKPEIIKKGDNSNCIHYEIVVGFTGTCKYCGQVRDYRPCYSEEDLDTLYREKSKRGQRRLQEVQQRKREKVALYG